MATPPVDISTDAIPQIEEIRRYLLRGVAAMQPKATNATLLRWMIVQKVVFKPVFVLKVLDDLIAQRLIGRDLAAFPCGCRTLEVYRLTDAGQQAVAALLPQ